MGSTRARLLTAIIVNFVKGEYAGNIRKRQMENNLVLLGHGETLNGRKNGSLFMNIYHVSVAQTPTPSEK